jgi:trigger factor
MQVTREDLNPCTVQLTIVCERDEVQQGFDKALKQIAKRIKLPGFRPGHVPKGMVEQYIDKDELNETAADAIIRQSYKKALDEQGIEPDPGTRASVDLKNLDQESGACEFVMKVPLAPVVELGEYKGLPIEKPKVDVTDEEVLYQIEELRKRRSTREAITDRGAQEGDVAVVNIKIDGEEGDGRNFMTIVGQTFPQLDQALSGMKVEEMKSLDLTFPENFQEKDWAGKPYKCQVSLNSISAVKMPELDDAFAQSLKTDNIDDLKTRLKSQIEKAKGDMVREIVSEQLLEKLVERSKIEVSDNMWEALALRRLQETEQEQREAGKTLEQYAAENGMTVESLTEAWRQKARMHVQRALAIREVFTQEKMTLSNAELNQELFAMANEYEIQPEEMLNLLRKNNALDELHFRAISRKVGDFLAENAEVKEVAMAAEA